MSYISESFMLHSDLARELYFSYAADKPIIDYHCHLPPRDVADNRRFRNLYEIWLEGDHYKWRAMRANGVSEDLCTGSAPDYDKYMAWARTVPYTLRNQLYPWTHLELSRYFGLDVIFNEESAPRVWDKANAMLATDELSAHGILDKFKVSVICTTDDPIDTLDHHKRIAESGIKTRIYPTFRPDKSYAVDAPEIFNPWVNRLEEVSGLHCSTFSGFLDALKQRHDFFHRMGGRLSDHGLESCFDDFCSHSTAAAIYNKARNGKAANLSERNQLASYLMVYYGHLDTEKGWTKQLHVGARRNNNEKLLQTAGPDVGGDSIGDYPQADALGNYLNRLTLENALPKMVVYNLNPRDNYMVAAMLGNFQDGSVPGKLQFGSGWWFLDQKEAMKWQMNALSNIGLFRRFVGMLTDSRSFLSYPRHEYFRRILCDLIASDVINGELPDEIELMGQMVSDIACDNAAAYFGFALGDY